jgi:trimeric autotransporter adhesin
VLVLEVTALAQPVVNPTNTTTTASLASSSPSDTNVANNSSSVNVQILPIPEVLVTKSALPLAAASNTEVVFTSIAANISTVNASTIIVTEDLPLFSSFKLGSIVFQNQVAPYNNSTLTVLSTEYFNGITWAYVPVSGAGGAPAGYDATVKNIRITFNGSIPPNGAFSIVYTLLVN